MHARPRLRTAGPLRPRRASPAGRGAGDDPADFNRLFPSTGGALYGPASHGWTNIVHAAGLAQRDAGALSGGGQHAPGTGRADGGDLGPPGGGESAERLRFDRAVPPGGYAWWYIDALSDDGRHGLTLIVFVGSVFSPYYAWARRGGGADPLNHCAFNIALYGGTRRWAMTERGASRVRREPDFLSIGPSSIRWTGEAIEVRLDEVCAPLPRRVRGSLRLVPHGICGRSFDLDARGLHRWSPFAPCARIDVDIEQPAQRWSGTPTWIRISATSRSSRDSRIGPGRAPACRRAPWCSTTSRRRCGAGARHGAAVRPQRRGARDRAARRGGAAQVGLGSRAAHARRCGGRSVPARHARGWAVLQPFAARHPSAGRARGRIHESLSLERFRSPWVQCLLPFRMPRRRN